MPQLDTIYMSMTFLWTWTTLNLIINTIKNVTITKTHKNQFESTQTPKLTLPWT